MRRKRRRTDRRLPAVDARRAVARARRRPPGLHADRRHARRPVQRVDEQARGGQDVCADRVRQAQPGEQPLLRPERLHGGRESAAGHGRHRRGGRGRRRADVRAGHEPGRVLGAVLRRGPGLQLLRHHRRAEDDPGPLRPSGRPSVHERHQRRVEDPGQVRRSRHGRLAQRGHHRGDCPCAAQGHDDEGGCQRLRGRGLEELRR
mmetsp:Transcript_32623/g.96909  ORF Transcript_32623/g.96909 Transcript_32623/m.96909 type:complete len:204 (-) Transcript_32623:1197-1808(-)